MEINNTATYFGGGAVGMIIIIMIFLFFFGVPIAIFIASQTKFKGRDTKSYTNVGCKPWVDESGLFGRNPIPPGHEKKWMVCPNFDSIGGDIKQTADAFVYCMQDANCKAVNSAGFAKKYIKPAHELDIINGSNLYILNSRLYQNMTPPA